jgi:hypothetical protein
MSYAVQLYRAGTPCYNTGVINNKPNQPIHTVRTQQRLYGTRTVFQKNYEILGEKVRNIISKILFILNFTAHIS